MASRFKIPDQYASGIAALRRQSDDTMIAFSKALSSVSPSLNSSALISAVSSLAASIPEPEIEGMVGAILSLYAAVDSADEEVEPFVDEICEAMAESKRKDLNFENAADRDRFKNRLLNLLNIESFGLASKALSLKHECANLFCTGRVLTDARPVYGADVSTAPHAALILHTLRLAYHEASTDLKEFYITFDDSDLKELREALDRAELKSKSLATALGAAGIAVVTTE